MASPFHSIRAEGIRVSLDLRVGHVRELVIERDGRRISPLHTAPWVGDPSVTTDETIAGNLRYLSGDFFCAPFALSDVENGPSHGWPANSPWQHVETTKERDGVTALYRLERPVLGATLEKRFTLRDNHPFLYESHLFRGGDGAVPVANHAMVRFPGEGRLSFSEKAFVETPAMSLEPDPARGRSRLAYPARTQDPTRMPMAGGGFADLTRYPIAERHEDFVMLVEARENRLGWLAASRPDSREVMLSLKNPLDFPVTFLWFSNGGRDYAPWNGRHLGVLGIEEGRAYSVYGHRASVAANSLSDAGIPTALSLRAGGRAEVRNVIGGVPLPAAASPVANVRVDEPFLELFCEDGARQRVPFDTAFLNPA